MLSVEENDLLTKIDNDAPAKLMDDLGKKPGILKIATVELPAEH